MTAKNVASHILKPKKIMVSVEGGMGNRIRAIASGLYLSERLGFELVIHWDKDHHCECTFDDLFSNNFKTINKPPTHSFQEFCRKELKGPTNFYGHSLLEDPDLGAYAIMPTSIADFSPAKNIVYGSSQLLPFITQYDASRFLKLLSPRPEIIGLVEQFCQKNSINSHVYGVHIRQSDNAHKHISEYISEMKQLVEENSNIRFFVCSDSPQAESEIVDLFPGRVICFPKTSYPQKRNPEEQWIIRLNRSKSYNVSRNKTAVYEGLCDLLILSRTTMAIRGVGSFYKAAELLNLKQCDLSTTMEPKRVPARWVDYYIRALRHFSAKYQTTDSRRYASDIKTGVSIVTACMNRSEQLKQSLKSWVACEQVSEIIIVDWSSTEPLTNSVLENDDPRVKLVRAEGQSRWCLSRAYNLAVSFARFNQICKLDVDYSLTSDFFVRHKINTGEFFTGSHRQARNQNEKHLNGFLFLYLEDFRKVNGYNERLIVYGWDDTDLYQRLISTGLSRKLVDNNLIAHAQHSDNQRLSGNLGRISSSRLIRANRRLSEELPWKIDDKIIRFDVEQRSETVIRCIPAPIVDSERNRRILLRAEGSLDCRLSALASCMALAVQTDRPLELLWPMTNECDSGFEDLFENTIPVIEEQDCENLLSKTIVRTILDESQRSATQKFSRLQGRDLFIQSRFKVRNRRIKPYMEEACLELLTPQQEFRSAILQFDLKNVIGVHVVCDAQPSYHALNSNEQQQPLATNTRAHWRQRSTPFHYLEQMQRLIERNHETRFLVSCKDPECIDFFSEKFTEDRICTWSRSGCSEAADDLVELYLLSRTSLILGSLQSSFSDIAGSMGTAKILYCGQDF